MNLNTLVYSDLDVGHIVKSGHGHIIMQHAQTLSLFVLLCMICVRILMYCVCARHQISSQFLSTLFFETESLLNLELTYSTRQADLQAQGSSCLCVSSTVVTGLCCHVHVSM